jgi:hypothetical protein
MRVRGPVLVLCLAMVGVAVGASGTPGSGLCGWVGTADGCIGCITAAGSDSCGCNTSLGQCRTSQNGNYESKVTCKHDNWLYTEDPEGYKIYSNTKTCKTFTYCQQAWPFRACSSGNPCGVYTVVQTAQAYYSLFEDCE